MSAARAAQRPLVPDAGAPVIVWFRQDLRLQDNVALSAAVATGRPIVPVYVEDRESEGDWAEGAASRWWKHHSLVALETSLVSRGLRLILRVGSAAAELQQVGEVTGATALYWNFRYEPSAVVQEKAVDAFAKTAGWESRGHTSELLFDPATIRNRQGEPFRVFSAYWRFVSTLPIQEPARITAKTLPAPSVWPRSVPLAQLELLPKRNWADSWSKLWTPGEVGAETAWRGFVKKIGEYERDRDVPGIEGSSRLSPHLHFGEISPRQIFQRVRDLSRDSGVFPVNGGAQKYLAEVGWREFAYYLLHYFPQTTREPFHRAFARMPWRRDPGQRLLRAWQRGRTGYPIVDAGMRELWATGWMPNRLRMICASFLVKHLLQPWTLGAEWHWDTLIDADLANNTLGWQWIAGSGADAAPFFRIFAPVTQGEKFDPQGDHVRRWVPEIAKLPTRYIHAPWTASADILAKAGVQLGVNYPAPIVDHAEARERALAAFAEMRREKM